MTAGRIASMRYRANDMPRLATLLVAALPLVLPATTAVAATPPRFGWLGLAPVEAGQTVARASKALGSPLTVPAEGAEAGCVVRSAANRPGARFFFDQGVLVRTDTRSPDYPTLRGARVGDGTDKVRRLYGQQLVVTPHPYFERGRILTVYSPDKRFALVMESNDNGRIITLRGGRKSAVERLEGCS